MKKLNKQGQVTVFIIVGILILFVSAGIFYLVSLYQEELLTSQENQPLNLKLKSKVNYLVKGCLEEVTPPGIYLLGIQGGVIYPINYSTVLVTENGLVNYGYLDGVNLLSRKNMEKEIGLYLKKVLNECLDNFSILQKEDIYITPQEEIKIQVKISKDYVLTTLDYSLEVKQGNNSFEISDFSSKTPIRLGNAINQANLIINQHQKNPAIVDMGYLNSFDEFISVFPFNEEITIFSINDDKSVINNAQFTFMFAIKDSDYNTAPKLDYISDKVLSSGGNFTYLINATDRENDLLTFSSDSKLFPVDKNGLLNLTKLKNGTYEVTFAVKDPSGLENKQKVRFVVE